MRRKHDLFSSVFLAASLGCAGSAAYEDDTPELNLRAMIKPIGLFCGCDPKQQQWFYCTPRLSGAYLMACTGPQPAANGDVCCASAAGCIPEALTNGRNPALAIRFPALPRNGEWYYTAENRLLGFYVW